jgi:hypothetical protein
MVDPIKIAKKVTKDDKIIKHHNSGNSHDYATPVFLEIYITNFVKFYYDNTVGNCKIGTVMQLENALGSQPEATMGRLKELFTHASRKYAFRATFTDIERVKLVAKTFPILTITRLPIGDLGRYQYHVLFRTHRTDTSTYRTIDTRVNDNGIQVSKDTVFKKDVASSELTKKQIEKIKSYKSKYYLVKYVQKLINGETV